MILSLVNPIAMKNLNRFYRKWSWIIKYKYYDWKCYLTSCIWSGHEMEMQHDESVGIPFHAYCPGCGKDRTEEYLKKHEQDY